MYLAIIDILSLLGLTIHSIFILLSSRSQEFDLTDPNFFFLLDTCQAKFICRDIISLQLKTQIAALYSSREQSAKNFEIDGIGFDWKAIEDQYSRDRLRADQGCAPRAPGLRYNFVYRDVWTRLNVLDAKIMQAYITMSTLFICDGQEMSNVL